MKCGKDTFERERYLRQMILPQIGDDGQALLKKARVLVVGIGGLGSPVATYLAGAGIGTLGLVDHQTVELSNLHRQPLFGENSVGRAKVESARQMLLNRNSTLSIVAFKEELSSINAEKIISPFDLVIDGTDNFAAKYLINDWCVLMDKPFISASLHRLSGQISIFNVGTGTGRGPTYRCLYPEQPLYEANCENVGILGPVAGVLGSMQAVEAIKHICNFGETLSGKVLVLDMLGHTFSRFNFTRLPDADSRAEEGRERRKKLDLRLITPRSPTVPLKNIFENKHDEPVLVTGAIPSVLISSLASDDQASGSRTSFAGVIRADRIGEAVVQAMEYTTEEAMALVEIRKIREEITSEFGLHFLRIIHSVGRVAVGEISLLVVLESGHRGASFKALEKCVNEVKSRVPIWGKEIYSDASTQWKKNSFG